MILIPNALHLTRGNDSWSVVRDKTIPFSPERRCVDVSMLKLKQANREKSGVLGEVMAEG